MAGVSDPAMNDENYATQLSYFALATFHHRDHLRPRKPRGHEAFRLTQRKHKRQVDTMRILATHVLPLLAAVSTSGLLLSAAII